MEGGGGVGGGGDVSLMNQLSSNASYQAINLTNIPLSEDECELIFSFPLFKHIGHKSRLIRSEVNGIRGAFCCVFREFFSLILADASVSEEFSFENFLFKFPTNINQMKLSLCWVRLVVIKTH